MNAVAPIARPGLPLEPRPGDGRGRPGPGRSARAPAGGAPQSGRRAPRGDSPHEAAGGAGGITDTRASLEAIAELPREQFVARRASLDRDLLTTAPCRSRGGQTISPALGRGRDLPGAWSWAAASACSRSATGSAVIRRPCASPRLAGPEGRVISIERSRRARGGGAASGSRALGLANVEVRLGDGQPGRSAPRRGGTAFDANRGPCRDPGAALAARPARSRRPPSRWTRSSAATTRTCGSCGARPGRRVRTPIRPSRPSRSARHPGPLRAP